MTQNHHRCHGPMFFSPFRRPAGRAVGLVRCVVIALAAIGGGMALGSPDDETPQRGAFTTTFTERTKISRLAVLEKQLRFKPDPQRPAAEYDITEETYEVYVPPSYRPGVPYGLIVWINAVDYGTPFEQWRGVLDKRFLIWVGANDSGNQHNTYRRIALALDAVANMTKRYTIDPQRVYGAGFSGGGRVASILTPTYPQIFQGGLFLCGVNYFRDVPAAGGKVWYGRFPPPPKRARTHSRFVLLTGDRDFNLENTKAVFNAFQQDRFRHATYLQVPGHDHEIPDTEWFDKSIAPLDEPLAAPAAKTMRLAAGMERNHKFGRAWLAYTKAHIHGQGQPFAAEAKEKADAIVARCDQELADARKLIEDKHYAKASGLLRRIKVQYQTLAEADVELLNQQVRQLRRAQRR